MTKLLRMTGLTASIAATALIAAPAVAAPTGSSNGPATARARIVKPLTLERVQNLDFGDIVVQDSGTATIDLAGAISCTGGLTCAATGTAAEYKVTGTNNQVVYITKPPVTLTNSVNPGTPLTLTLTGPASVTLPNSGATGMNFNIGGSVPIAASTNEGVYMGDLAVTVDYQ